MHEAAIEMHTVPPPDPAFQPLNKDTSKMRFNGTFFVLLILAILALVGIVLPITLSQEITIQVTISVISGLIFLTILIDMRRRYCLALPNEWLLVIEDGIMVRAGVGMRHFRGTNQTVVQFPSSIQRVNFRANQVTNEMQGLEISGFAIWSVFRDGQGPFNAFKMLSGLGEEGIAAANENLTRMCESIIRHQVSNLSIQEVLTKRELVRNKTKDEVLDVVRGWGMWIETVEITDVTICSSRLFNDLQSEFRQKSHRDAEHVRLLLEGEIASERVQRELEIAKDRAEAKSEQLVYEAEQDLKREKAQYETWRQQQEIEAMKLKEQESLELARVEKEAKVKMASTNARIGRESAEAEHSNSIETARMAVENQMTDKNLHKLELENTREIYSALPLSSIKLVNVPSGQGLASLLPGLLESYKALKED